MSEPRQDDRRRDRLIEVLGESGAFGTASPLDCGRIALFRRVGLTSLGAGYAAADDVAALVRDGFAAWSGQGRARRLTLVVDPAPDRRISTKLANVDGTLQPVLYDERESPLLWLHRRKGKDGQPQISQIEFAAGERLRADLTLAQMLPRTTMNWDASLSSGAHGHAARDPASASDSALAARQRVRLACDRLGPDLSGIAIDVCGFLKGLDQIERERQWPSRSAKVVLRLALSALAAHYGLDRQDGPALRRPRAWLADDARAQIQPAGA